MKKGLMVMLALAASLPLSMAQQPTAVPPPVLTAHTLLVTRYNAPYNIAFSGDGSQIAAISAATDGDSIGDTALQWYANGEIREIERAPEVFYSVAFHPILPQLVAGGYSGSIDLYTTPDMTLLNSILGHESAPLVVYAPDGRSFVTADWSGLLIWSGLSNEVSFIVTDEEATPENPARVAISPDGQYVAWLRYPSTIVITSLATGEEVGSVFTGYDVEPYQIGFTPSNQIALAYGTLEIWDMTSGQLVDRVITTDAVRDFEYSRDGQRLVMLTADNVARVLNTASGETIAVANAENAQAWDVALSGDGARLAVGLENAIAVYDVP